MISLRFPLASTASLSVVGCKSHTPLLLVLALSYCSHLPFDTRVAHTHTRTRTKTLSADKQVRAHTKADNKQSNETTKQEGKQGSGWGSRARSS